VEVQDTGIVEEHLTFIGEDLLDDLVDGVVPGRGPTTAVGEQAIALWGDVLAMMQAGLDQERLAALTR
jgi:hypothetical protein